MEDGRRESEVVIDRIMAVVDEEWEREEEERKRRRGKRKSRSRSAKGGEIRKASRNQNPHPIARGATRSASSGQARVGLPAAGKKQVSRLRNTASGAGDIASLEMTDVRGTEVGMKFPPKRVGEIGELEFIQKAIRMGFVVSKPWGDSDRYDAVTDWKGRLLRVQVRATDHRMGPRGFAVHASVYVGKKIVGLTKKDIDVLAAYIFSKDLWYIVPVEKFEPRKNLWFYPDGSVKGSMFEEFREAWEWLKEKRARTRRRK